MMKDAPTTASKMKQFLNIFRADKLWRDMEANVEDSSWHREKNTSHHMQMMTNWYMDNLWEIRTEKERLLTLLAITFHDVGKPSCRAWSDEKNRFQFSGHEQRSAYLMMQWMIDHPAYVKKLELSWDDIHAIHLMVYHHVPFTYKREELRDELKWRFVRDGTNQCFIDLIMCDQYGRISDDHQANQDRVFEWLEGWNQMEPSGYVHMGRYPKIVPPPNPEDYYLAP